jgi:hypothetical protein
MATAAERFQTEREQLVGELERLARQDARLLALWLEGSLADGSADALSDVDAHFAIDDAAFDTVWQQRRELVGQLRPILVAVDLFFPGLQGLACILEGPVKLDLIFERASSVAQHTRPAARILVDKAGLGPTLKSGHRQPIESVIQRITAIYGGIRQGATWPVRLLLRGQWATFAMCELEVINDNLATLIAVQIDPQLLYKNRLVLSRLLPAERRQQLEDLTQMFVTAYAQRDLPALLAAHLAINAALVREARAAYAALGVLYPISEANDAALRAFYERDWPRTLPE